MVRANLAVRVKKREKPLPRRPLHVQKPQKVFRVAVYQRRLKVAAKV